MRIEGIDWRHRFLEKIRTKHGVEPEEVEEVLLSRPVICFSEKGKVYGEHLYAAYGRSLAGRYLVVFFIRKPRNVAMPVSARDMTKKERQTYGQSR